MTHIVSSNNRFECDSVIGTPRPRRISDEKEEEQEYRPPTFADATTTHYYYDRFAKAAKDAAAATKRKRTPFSRTYYRMAASRQVKVALDVLEERVKKNEIAAAPIKMLTYADFQLLKKGIEQFRVRLNVHDNKTYSDIKEMHAQLKSKHQELNANTTPQERADLIYWHAEIMKEVYRIEPKVKYTNIGGGLFRHEFDKAPTDPPGVPSQHAEIAPGHGHALRNILTPETIRRTFISLNSLTNKIREEVAAFLQDENREADRAEVIRQIKNEMK